MYDNVFVVRKAFIVISCWLLVYEARSFSANCTILSLIGLGFKVWEQINPKP